MFYILMYVNCLLPLVNLLLIEIGLNLKMPITPTHGIVWSVSVFIMNVLCLTYLFIKARKHKND
jgi:hypothetical protein